MNWLLRRLRRNEHLFALARELRDMKSLADGLRKGTFSQHGEDVFIKQLLGEKRGFYVDIGASHPFRISNTFLLYRSGWRGVTVEPIPELCRLHKRWRPADTLVQAAISPEPGSLTFFEMLPSVLSTLDPLTADQYVREGKAELLRKYPIQVMTPMQLLAGVARDRVIDVLTIDVEGLDLSCIAAIDFNVVRPRLLCIEVNAPGESDQLASALERHGYHRLARLGCNLLMGTPDVGLPTGSPTDASPGA